MPIFVQRRAESPITESPRGAIKMPRKKRGNEKNYKTLFNTVHRDGLTFSKVMVILPLLIVQEQSSGRTASYNSMSILRTNRNGKTSAMNGCCSCTVQILDDAVRRAAKVLACIAFGNAGCCVV
jgi:hypothetical protein